MTEKRTKTMGMLAVFIMLSSAVFAGMVVTTQAIIVPPRPIDLKVWNETSSSWGSEILTEVGKTLRFNVTVRYVAGGSIFNINISDILPTCLDYDEGSTVFFTGRSTNPQLIVGNTIYWNFTGDYQLVLSPAHPQISIEFNATVIASDDVTSEASFVADASEPPHPISDSSSVHIMISPIKFEKVVKNKEATWQSHTVALINDTISFKISLTYYGLHNLSNIRLVDTLPPFLVIDTVTLVHGVGSIENSSNKKMVWINFTTQLNQTVPTIEVLITANVTETAPVALDNNTATMTAIEIIPSTITPIVSAAKASITIVANSAPLVPNKPSGVGIGYTGVKYWYSTTTTDANGDAIYYQFNWSDGPDSEWIGPLNSGDVVSANHTWMTVNYYYIRVRAKDSRGATSDWTIKDEDHSGRVFIFQQTQPPVNQPPLPPLRPQGNTTGKTEESIIFTTNTTDPDGNPVRFGWDWNNDSTVDDWTSESDLFDSGENCSIPHSYSAAGTYDIKVKAMDVHGAESTWSSVLTVAITSDNSPPSIPTLTGPSEGGTNKTISFSAVSTDPDGDQISYYFNWGDGTSSGWTTSYLSGFSASVSHSWNTTGTFSVKVKAKDGPGHESDWSSVKMITISASESLSITDIKGGLGIKATITNDGTLVANNFHWNITVKGSRVFRNINVAVNGTIDSLAVGSDIVVKTSLVRGYGKVSIKVTVDGASIETTTKTVDGFVFGFFIFVSK